MRAFLIQAEVYDPALQGPRSVRWTNAVDQTVYGGTLYAQGLLSIPEISSEIAWDGDFGGGSRSSVSSLIYSMNSRDRDDLARLLWEGATLTVLRGRDGDLIGGFETLCVLEIQSASLADYQLTLEFRDWREKMLIPLTRRLAGTGGYEGTVNDQGKVLPRGFGAVRHAPAEFVKKSTFVRRFAQGPVHAVARVQSRGVDIPVQTVVSGIAALEAFTITPGYCVVDLANGALRSRLDMAEPVTVSFEGETTGGYTGGIIEIARRLMRGRVTEKTADWDALAALQPAAGQLYLAGNETLADALDKILLGIGCWWGVDVTTGEVECGRFDFSAQVATLVAADVNDLEMESAKAPFAVRRLGFAVNNRPLADAEIAFALVDQDARNDAAAALQAANSASQNAASALAQAQSVTSRVNDIVSDSVLDAGEKPDLVRILADITNEYLIIDASANAFGVFAERTTYQTVKTALDAYIAALVPPVTNYAVSTTVLRSVLSGHLNDYYYGRAALLDKFPAIAATRAFWGNVTGAGRPEDGATRNEPGGIHNSALAYLKGTFVRNTGGTTTYIAKSAVPAGVALTNTVYWDEFVTGGGGAPGADARDYLVQPMIIAVETDGTGNSGVFPRSAQLKYYDGTVDKTATGQVIYTVVGAPAWASVDAAGAISISEFGNAFEVQFDASYTGQTRRVTLALAKQKSGLPGGTVKAIDLTADRLQITFDGTGALAPAVQTTNFSVTKQNTSALVYWTAHRLDGSVINPVTNILSAASGDAVSVTATAFNSELGGTNGVLITATVVDGATLRDTVSVVKVQNGTDGARGPIGPPGGGGAPAIDDSLTGFSGGGDTVIGAVTVMATSNSLVISAGLSYFASSGSGTPHFKVIAITPGGTINLTAFAPGEPVFAGEPGNYTLEQTTVPTGIAVGRAESWTLQLLARRSANGNGNLNAGIQAGSAFLVRY
jgi:hypothetical protein